MRKQPRQNRDLRNRALRATDVFAFWRYRALPFPGQGPGAGRPRVSPVVTQATTARISGGWTGIPLVSALRLDVSDVDLARGEILLRHAKGDREVCHFLPPAIRQLLRQFLRSRTAGSVFQGRPGKPLCARQFQVRFAAWQKKAGIARPVSPHGLRHTFAMRLYHGTRDLLLVKEALGHRSIMSTMVYVGAVCVRRRAV